MYINIQKSLSGLVIACMTIIAQATVIDSFQTQQTTDTNAFAAASETITGNRLFAVDGPSATATLGAGQMQCQLSSTDDEDSICSTAYNAGSGFVDLTESGQNSGIRVVVSELMGDVELAIQLTDQSDISAGTLIDLSPGNNEITFSELFGITGTPDYARIKGILIGYAPLDSGQNTRFTIDLIETLTGDGSNGNGNGTPPINLNGRYSGSFFDPDRNGEGIQLVALPDNQTVTVSWYTYLNGNQVWLVGAGNMSQNPATIDLRITDGADYGAGFNPSDVNRRPWGTLTMSWVDCNTLDLQARTTLADYQDLDLRMTRIVRGDCMQIDQGNTTTQDAMTFESTGSYFDPARNGEGMQLTIEANGQSVAASWYTYFNGEQIWLAGTGSRSQDQVMIDATITNGADFGDAFEADDVVRTPWGLWQINFVDCNNIELVASPSLPDYESITIAMTKVAGQISCS